MDSLDAPPHNHCVTVVGTEVEFFGVEKPAGVASEITVLPSFKGVTSQIARLKPGLIVTCELMVATSGLLLFSSTVALDSRAKRLDCEVGGSAALAVNVGRENHELLRTAFGRGQRNENLTVRVIPDLPLYVALIGRPVAFRRDDETRCGESHQAGLGPKSRRDAE